MLTPSFKLEQTDTVLRIEIKAPFANVAQTEIDVNDDEFCFSSWPYYLRLHLPGPIEETESSKGEYNSDPGVFHLEFSKKNKNEYFPHLDLIGSFLTPKPKKSQVKPDIVVVSRAGNEDEDEGTGVSDEEEDWHIEQTLPIEMEPLEPAVGEYGFGNQTKGMLSRFPKEELAEIIDLHDPDNTSPLQIQADQRTKEFEQFSDDHYLADLMDPPKSLQSILEFKADWSQNQLSQENVETLKDIGSKEFLLSSTEKKFVAFSLVDILFAFAYDHRTTKGIQTSESAWTINKLSATLTWFSRFNSLKEAVVSAYRRSLCYPLYRHWKLSNLVFKDVISILESGHNQILLSLLKIYSLFQESEPRYLLNQLYIKDYIIWVQKLSDGRLDSLKLHLQQVVVEKTDVDLDLEDLEHAANLIKGEEDTLVRNLENLNLSEDTSSSSAYDSSSDDNNENEKTSTHTSPLCDPKIRIVDSGVNRNSSSPSQNNFVSSVSKIYLDSDDCSSSEE